MICLCATYVPRAADATALGAPTVLYLSSSDTRDLDEKLLRYLKAHLSSDFEVLVVNAPPALDGTGGPPYSAVRELIQTQGAVAAVQPAADGKTVSVTAPEISQTPWSIAVPGETPGSANWCESVAVLILSDIASLVPPVPSVPPVPTVPPAPTVPPKSIADPKAVPDAPSPSTRDVSVSIVVGRVARASKSRRLLPVRVGGALGYAPARQVSEKAMLHGAQVDLEVGFGPYLQIALQSDIGQKADVTLGSRNATLRRFPFRALIYGSLPLKDFVLAVGAGVVWAPTCLRDLSYVPADSEIERVQHLWGGAAQVSAEYWVVPWFGIRCAGGVDMFTDEVRLTYEDAVVLRVNRVGAVMFFGLTGRFAFKGDKRR